MEIFELASGEASVLRVAGRVNSANAPQIAERVGADQLILHVGGAVWTT